jgi:acyl dehydratase
MTTQITVIPSLSAVKDYVGVPLGASEWVQISQQRIDAFADATGDHQWIHCDAERAARESPWKTTIAHGYLTLSLVPQVLEQLIEVSGCATLINTGLDRMRLPAPVPVGSRVRLRGEIQNARDLSDGGVRVRFAIRIEVEGSARPALLAALNCVYLPPPPA